MNYMKRIDNLIGSTPVAVVCNAAGQVVRSLTCDSREVSAGSCFFAVTVPSGIKLSGVLRVVKKCGVPSPSAR